MKKVLFWIWLLSLIISFQQVNAETGTCGTNVKYTISGNTISFSKANSASDAEWDWDCREVFYDKSNITAVKVTNTIRAVSSFKHQNDESGYAGLFINCRYIQEMDLSKLDTSKVKKMNGMFSGCSALTSLKMGNWNTSNVEEMGWMFNNCSSLTTLDVSNWNTSKVTLMTSMFAYCSSLTTLDVSKWDTSNVTDMNSMFSYCSALTKLDVSSWNTSKVTNMRGMFFLCKALKNLDVSAWNTSKVTSMDYMFGYCNSLTALDVSKWNTSNVTDMKFMFEVCSGLTSLDVSKWNTSKVTDMYYMFGDCSALTGLNVGSWNTSKVTDMACMFLNCSKLKSLDVRSWNTSNVTDMHSMFHNCSVLTGLNVGSWNTSKVTDMDSMFLNCSKLNSLDVKNWNTSKVTVMKGMFYGCTALTGLNVSSWNTSKVTDMSYMFYKCSVLTGLNVGSWNTSKVTDMSYMFYYCSALPGLDVSSWNTSNVTNTTDMFGVCSSLTGLDVSKWNTAKVKDTSYMFYHCSALNRLDVSLWNTSKVTNMHSMFYNCSRLTGLNVSAWNTSNVTDMYAMFYNCSSLTALDVSKWNTSKATNMYAMFEKCSALTNLDVSGWITSNLTKMSYMFKDCSSLTNLDVRSWNTSNVTSMYSMFSGCSSLTNLDVSKWNTSNVTTMYCMFYKCSSLTDLDISGWNTSNETEMGSMFSGCDSLHMLTLGKNSLKKNIFTSLPAYGSAWYYILQGEDAGKPLPLKTAKKNGSLFTSYNYNTMAGTWSTDRASVYLHIKDSNIRGKNKEIQVVIPWSADLKKVECRLYDDETGKQVSPLPAYRERMDANKKNRIVSYTGSPLENGHVYRLEIRVWNGVWSNKVTKYGMPIANVYGATVVAGNKTMTINNRHREPCDGTRYMIYDPDTGKEIAYKAATRTNTTWTYSKLTNGKLYYAVAVSYRDYKGQRLWGPNENRIWFVPMTAPVNPESGVVLSGSNVTVTITKDPDADGLRVLYRKTNGALGNGCEAKGNKCTVKNLSIGTVSEFYIMKYKEVDGKKYYSMGLLLRGGNDDYFGLKRPQMNPTVAMSNSGSTTFTIKKAAEAEGISVLYREGEGAFRQACEAAGNSCNTTLDVKVNYTFYIMQYRTENGKKLYSPGIVARDFSSGKTGTGASSAADIPEEVFLGKALEEVPAEETVPNYSLDLYRLEEKNQNGPVPGFGN